MSVRRGASREYNELQRQTERLSRVELARKLQELRARIKAAKKAKRARTVEIRGLARKTLATIRAKTRELRAALRAASDAARYLARYAVKGGRVIVSAEQASALRLLATEHEGITHEEAQAKDDARERRSAARGVAWRKADERAARRKVGRGERRAESISDVRANLPPELLPVFEYYRSDPRAARQWKATAYKTATEAFLEWAGEHSAEVERATRAAEHESYGEQSEADYAAEQELAAQLARVDAARMRRAGGMR